MGDCWRTISLAAYRPNLRYFERATRQDDVLKMSFNLRQDSKDVLQMSSNVHWGSQDVLNASSNVRRDSEDVVKMSFNLRRDPEDVLKASSSVLPAEQLIDANLVFSQLVEMESCLSADHMYKGKIHLLMGNARLHFAKSTQSQLEKLNIVKIVVNYEVLPAEQLIDANLVFSQLVEMESCLSADHMYKGKIHLLMGNARLHFAKSTQSQLEKLNILHFFTKAPLLYIEFIHTILRVVIEFLLRLFDAVLNNEHLMTVLREKSVLESQFFLNLLVVVVLLLFAFLAPVRLQPFFVGTQVEVDDIFFWLVVISRFSVSLISIEFIRTILRVVIEFLLRLFDAVLNNEHLMTVLREKSVLESQFFLNLLVVVVLLLFAFLAAVRLQPFFVGTQVEVDDIFFWLVVISRFSVSLISGRTDSFFSSQSSRRLASISLNLCFTSVSSRIILVVKALSSLICGRMPHFLTSSRCSFTIEFVHVHADERLCFFDFLANLLGELDELASDEGLNS
ncbi:unnamed protein product [Heligmosomoides polygyrus]|uniref:PKD_channel domain-containing protein n=1 Tax=Heligmosomoides polygyrus TaxID=6339 RepID=A0A183G7G9_HELPZ|nr:unnamed protein product [Heligmosomoides polygyrus]